MITGANGKIYLFHGGYRYRKNQASEFKVWWICSSREGKRCKAAAVTCNGVLTKLNGVHTHDKVYE